MSWLDELELELRKTGMPAARRRRIVTEFADHLASDPGSEERLGSPAALARQFADEVGTGNTSALRSVLGGVRPTAGVGFALLATFLVCFWAGTYQELTAVGPIRARYTPIWAVPMAVAVGVGGTLLALLIYRHARPTDKRGRLLLWGLLSALLVALGSPSPWLSLRFIAHGELQQGLVLVAAVVGAVLLVALRQRRSAGVAALLAGLLGLGITLHAATYIWGPVLYGPFAPYGFGAVGWELDFALLASLSLALCGLVWLLALANPPQSARAANTTPYGELADL
jgi:hypothetical protein